MLKQQSKKSGNCLECQAQAAGSEPFGISLRHSPEVLVFYRERTNSTTPRSQEQRRGALSIKRLEGGHGAAAAWSYGDVSY